MFALGSSQAHKQLTRKTSRDYRDSATGKMMMKIKLSCAVAALVILSSVCLAYAQHNHIQSSVSGQYQRRIHDSDQGAGTTTQAIDNRGEQPKTKKHKKASAGPVTERKN